MSVRATILVSGRVQAVGYREFVDEVAFPLELRGFVENTPDGNVRIVCEGPRRAIDRFVKGINIVRYPIRVSSVSVRFSRATGEFNGFRIIRDGDMVKETYERMDAAARHLREMHYELVGKHDEALGKQDRMLEKQDTMIEKQDRMLEKQDETLVAIKSMDRHMGERFDRLDAKYDKFGRAIGAMAVDIRVIRRITEGRRSAARKGRPRCF